MSCRISYLSKKSSVKIYFSYLSDVTQNLITYNIKTQFFIMSQMAQPFNTRLHILHLKYVFLDIPPYLNTMSTVSSK